MIRPDEVISIGKFTRTHGVQGELAMSFTDDVFDRVDCPYLVCSMDGILVPFFMESYRFKSDTVALIKFERVDSVEQARAFAGKEVFFPRSYYEADEEDEYTWNLFRGYTAADRTIGPLGTVADVDDTTLNVLFVIDRPDGSEVLVPAQEVFIDDIDHDRRHIVFNLPEGLIE